MALLYAGRHNEAIAELEKFNTAKPGVFSANRLALAYAVAGKPAQAQALLDKTTLENVPDPDDAHDTAFVLAALGEKLKALDLLEQSYRRQTPNLWLLKVDPIWDNLRTEPRFADMLRRLHLDN